MPKASGEAPEAPQDVPEQPEGGGGTVWRRFALVAVPGFVAAAVLGGMTTQGLLAASFAVSGDSFKMSADELVGQGFTQYGAPAQSVDGSSRAVGLSSVETAELTNLCMSSLWDLSIGEATLVIEAGEAKPVTGTDLVLDIEQLRGDAEFDTIEIGRDASTLDRAEGGQGPAGGFGLQSESITVSDMELTTWAVTSGSLRLSGLKLAVKPGNHECF
ncbi:MULTISPECIES: DUF6230 family protein [Nocardiopsis]|jgi:hypothetical protein|uniref:Cholesterol esterase n=1 Tax=Nocardiopsis sinuspersici TaxID=501010 RepID=A0A1V3BWA8_9ACTN|nr:MULTISPECIES: DUF6230 family protein [Nocardiopsis]NYH53903.1 hypothetical protein [Nocardiopsis sinuspersici]OOC52811.1 cholesterol esterase [Nocardiopsis sinuspersici]